MSLHPAPPAQTCQDYEAKPITPPDSAGVPGSHRCVVDYDHKPFSITWTGSWDYPDLAGFPSLQNIEISPLHQTSEMAAIWRDSTLYEYGSYASVRITEHGRYPILKLAHSDEVSIKLIQHEFEVLAKLTKLGLPVVEFDQQPILDNGVICGYRMEKLSKVELSEFVSRAHDIKQALDRFHCAGFSHGDVSPSNVMTKDGRIILIDLSFAGPLGSAVPSFFPDWVYTNGSFSMDTDLAQFGRFKLLM